MRTRDLRSLLLAVCAGAACAELPPIGAEECGNGVIERGEDCDRFAATGLSCTDACRYACGAEAPGAACPEGWGCGDDGLCRHGAAEFRAGPSQTMAAETLHAGDVDGDGALDLLGYAGARLAVRFGAGGGYSDGFDLTLDKPTGTPAFADLDADGRVDIVVPQAGGFSVLQGQDDQTLAPVAFSSLEVPLDPAADMMLIPLFADIRFGTVQVPIDQLLLVVGGGGQTSAFFLGPYGDPPPEIVTTFPGHDLADVAGRLPIADIDPGPTDAKPEIAFPFVGATTVPVYAIAVDAAERYRLVARAEVRLPSPIEHGAAFVDVDGDGDLDLIASVKNAAGTSQVVVSLGNGAGGFDDGQLDGDDAYVDTRFQEIALGSGSPWPIAAGDLNGDGFGDYVAGNGLYLGFPSGIYGFWQRNSPKPWVEAVIADFNRDGFADLAAVAQTDGVDFLMGGPSGFFTADWRDTDGLPHMLRAGDFDGDQVTDLALAEKSLAVGEGSSVSVLFGDLQGAPAAAVDMGDLQYIQSMERGDFVTDANAIDDVDDLIVMSRATPVTGAWSGAIMLGSAGRQLQSPFLLSAEDLDDPMPARAVAVGRFSGPGDALPDVLALSWTSDATAAPRVWLIAGAGDPLFTAQGVDHVDPQQLEGGAFSPECAVWATGDVDGDGATDEVVGIDRTERCGLAVGAPRILVVTLASGLDDPELVVSPLGGGFATPREVTLADVDGDGALDLIASFAGGGEGDRGGAAVYWGGAGGLGVADPATVAAPEGTAVRSACAINADGDPAAELAIATEKGVYLADPTSGRAFGAPTRLFAVEGADGVSAADVDGDGLADLLVSSRRGVEVFFAVAAEAGE